MATNNIENLGLEPLNALYSFLCHLYVTRIYSYVTRLNLYVIRTLLVYTCM